MTTTEPVIPAVVERPLLIAPRPDGEPCEASRVDLDHEDREAALRAFGAWALDNAPDLAWALGIVEDDLRASQPRTADHLRRVRRELNRLWTEVPPETPAAGA